MNRALGEVAAVAEAEVDDMMMKRALGVAAEVAVAVVEYPMKRTSVEVVVVERPMKCTLVEKKRASGEAAEAQSDRLTKVASG